MWSKGERYECRVVYLGEQQNTKASSTFKTPLPLPLHAPLIGMCIGSWGLTAARNEVLVGVGELVNRVMPARVVCIVEVSYHS